MSLVEAYILRIVRSSFLVALGVLTAVIWVTQALKEFDLLTTKGQSLVVFLGVTALGIPALVMVIAPIALFMAVLYALNKLNGDSELIVMSAAYRQASAARRLRTEWLCLSGSRREPRTLCLRLPEFDVERRLPPVVLDALKAALDEEQR